MGWETDDDKDFVNPPHRKRPRGEGKFSKKKSRKRHQQRWWTLRPSEVTRDPRFEDKPLGLGVFATRPIKKKIYFDGEFKCKTLMTDRERDYGIQTDIPNYIITPTDSQIRTGDLKYYWRINHSTDKPTHRLEYDCRLSRRYPHGRPVLIPLRSVRIGDEITFDYNNK